jgi:hypothetical protein
LRRELASLRCGDWSAAELSSLAEGMRAGLTNNATLENNEKATIADLASFTCEGWLVKSQRGKAIPLVRLLRAIVFPAQWVAKAGPREVQRRLASLVTAVSSLTKAVHSRWSSPIGTLLAFNLHMLTQSQLAVTMASALGTGGPRRPPQYEVYRSAMEVLQTCKVVAADGTNVCVYFDNTQSGDKKTSRMRPDGV